MTLTLKELEERIRILEDIEDIKKKTAALAYYIDTGNWQEVVDLFTEDVFFDSGLGQYEGKAGVTKFFRDDLPLALPFTIHMCHNPIIDVSDEQAKGQWYMEAPATNAVTNRALWAASKYEIEYKKVRGIWKIKTFVSKIYYITPYDEGWTKTRMYT